MFYKFVATSWRLVCRRLFSFKSTMSASDNVPSSPVLPVADSLANLAIQQSSPSPVSRLSPVSPLSRPFITYSRPQLLFIHKSPLVQPPCGMPALKDWFGFVLPLLLCHQPAHHHPRTENDQSGSKKDSETPLPAGNTRDRRCVVESPPLPLLTFHTQVPPRRGGWWYAFPFAVHGIL